MRPRISILEAFGLWSVGPSVGRSVRLSSKSTENGLWRILNVFRQCWTRKKEGQVGRRKEEWGTRRKDGRGGRNNEEKGATRKVQKIKKLLKKNEKVDAHRLPLGLVLVRAFFYPGTRLYILRVYVAHPDTLSFTRLSYNLQNTTREVHWRFGTTVLKEQVFPRFWRPLHGNAWNCCGTLLTEKDADLPAWDSVRTFNCLLFHYLFRAGTTSRTWVLATLPISFLRLQSSRYNILLCHSQT